MKKQNDITGFIKLFKLLIWATQKTRKLPETDTGNCGMLSTDDINMERNIFKQHKQGFFPSATERVICLLFRPITPHSCKHHHHQNTAKQLAGDAGPNPTIVFHYSLPVTRNRREFRMGILPALRRVQCSGLKKGGAMK